jgi:hypothetical protein
MQAMRYLLAYPSRIGPLSMIGRCKEAGRRGREGREVPGALCYARASGGSPRRWHLEITVGAAGEATKGVMPCDGPGSPSTTFTPT